MQVAVHCIGDRAMDMVIEAIEKSPYRKDNPKGRHGIVHAQITNQRILENMAKNDILAYIQPVFIGYDMNILEDRVGKHRMPFKNTFGGLDSQGSKVQGAVFFHFHVTALLQKAHCAADAGLGITHMLRNIHRAHIAVLLVENEHSLKIIF